MPQKERIVGERVFQVQLAQRRERRIGRARVTDAAKVGFEIHDVQPLR